MVTHSGAIHFYSRIENAYQQFSNYAVRPITISGAVYPSVEHYYVWAKCTSDPDRAHILSANTPGEAKRRGRCVLLRHNWSEIRLDVMRQALRAKFTQHADLQALLLLGTGDCFIYEDSPDMYWGYASGRGQNWLGSLLMELRTELRRELG